LPDKIPAIVASVGGHPGASRLLRIHCAFVIEFAFEL
jgi:hypothetical protein